MIQTNRNFDLRSMMGVGVLLAVGLTGCQTASYEDIDTVIGDKNVPGHASDLQVDVETPQVAEPRPIPQIGVPTHDAKVVGVDIVEVGTQGAAGCNKPVMAKSSHAVGNPCMTTREFMQQLGLSQYQMDWVLAHQDTVGHPERVAH